MDSKIDNGSIKRTIFKPDFKVMEYEEIFSMAYEEMILFWHNSF